MKLEKEAAGCDEILFSSQDKSWPKYYGERGPAWSLVFCPPHPISPTQHTAPWDFSGTNNFIWGIILQCATSSQVSWWKSSRFLHIECAQNHKKQCFKDPYYLLYYLLTFCIFFQNPPFSFPECIVSPLHLWRQDPGLSFLSRWLINLSNAITATHFPTQIHNVLLYALMYIIQVSMKWEIRDKRRKMYQVWGYLLVID